MLQMSQNGWFTRQRCKQSTTVKGGLRHLTMQEAQFHSYRHTHNTLSKSFVQSASIQTWILDLSKECSVSSGNLEMHITEHYRSFIHKENCDFFFFLLKPIKQLFSTLHNIAYQSLTLSRVATIPVQHVYHFENACIETFVKLSVYYTY